MKARTISVVAHYTALEAIRTRTLHVGATALAAWLALTLFAGELAVTENVRMRTALFAGGARLILVFVVCLYVAQSIAREHGDRSVELILGRAVARSEYYLGKFVGCAVIALTLAVLAAVVPLREVSACAALAWGIGLTLELIVAIALTLFAASSIGQLLPALTTSLAFYVLGRASDSILNLAHASTVNGADPTTRIVVACADLLVRLIPDLSRFAPTDTLLGESSGSTLTYATCQTLLYCMILLCAGILDLRRKDL